MCGRPWVVLARNVPERPDITGSNWVWLKVESSRVLQGIITTPYFIVFTGGS